MFFKNNFKILLLTFVFLFVGSSVSAVVNYSRTPTGTLITSPIHMSVSFTDFEEFCTQSPLATSTWAVRVWSLDWENSYETEHIATGTLSAEFDLELPADQYVLVNSTCYPNWSDSYELEYDSDEMIFEIVEYNYIPLSINLPADLLAYAGALFTDLSVPIIMIVGLPLGFWVIKKIISLVRVK